MLPPADNGGNRLVADGIRTERPSPFRRSIALAL